MAIVAVVELIVAVPPFGLVAEHEAESKAQPEGTGVSLTV
jgi:hypothetical protein